MYRKEAQKLNVGIRTDSLKLAARFLRERNKQMGLEIGYPIK